MRKSILTTVKKFFIALGVAVTDWTCDVCQRASTVALEMRHSFFSFCHAE